MQSDLLTRDDILRLFTLLDAELAADHAEAELYVVGGAVMCLSLGARSATRDVDAVFKPTKLVREAAARVAIKANAPEDWLNDAVKSFLGENAKFVDFLELDRLRVFVADPSYLLAMKCAAMRLGAEFHDLEDVRYLLRHLNITSAQQALEIVTQYFDPKSLPAKTRLALEELLG